MDGSQIEEKAHQFEALTVRTPKTSEVVADQIRAQIIRGELSEGDTLPPEGQLMNTLGISRPTLREAIRILEAEKLVTVTRGSRSGAKVHMPRAELTARYAGYVLQSQRTTISDLYTAQVAIEPYVVGALCRMRSNKKAVNALKKHVEALENLVETENFDLYPVGVSEFHFLLVQLSGSKTLTFINQLLLNLVTRHKFDFLRRNAMDLKTRKMRMMSGNKSFNKLIALIEAKEEEAAVAHWRLHLKNAHATWTRAGEGERIVDSLSKVTG